MNNLRKWLYAAAMTMAAMWLGAGPAHAAVTAVAVNPASQNIALGANSMLRVRWAVTYSNAAPSTIVSTEGLLRAGVGGPILATVPTVISRSVPGPASATEFFREAVPVSEQIVLRAQQLGASQIVYERTFDDGGGAAGAGALFNLTGSAGARLSLSRIALRFPDNSRVKVMGKDATTHVLADLTFTGTGRLEAVWEIADPASTAGNPSFRTLRLIRRQLVGGGQQLTLRSPELPTQATGLYLVRLRITSPVLSFDSPVIRYFVNAGVKTLPPVGAIRALKPGEGTIINRDTRFEWSAVPGARVYQVEFRGRRAPLVAAQIPSLGESHQAVPEEGEAEDTTYPMAGIMVAGTTQQLSLSALSLSRLTPGSSYGWRVLAYDERGQLIASSELRSIVIPYDAKSPRVVPVSPPAPAPAPAPDPEAAPPADGEGNP